MKFIRALNLTMIAAMLLSSHAAFPQTSAPKSKASSASIPKHKVALPVSVPNTDDIETLVRQLVASGSGTKGEFETTPQFEARQKKAVQPDRQYAFVYVWDAFNNRSDSVYDADKAVMTINMSIEHQGFKPTYDRVLSILIKHVLRRTEHHIGQNSYGARVRVESRLEDKFGIVIDENSASWLQTFSRPSEQELQMKPDSLKRLQQMYPELHSPAFSVPVSIEKAKELKDNVRIVLVGTLPNAQVYRGESFDEATISDPLEVTVNRFYVNLLVSEVRIVDSRTGKVLANFMR